MTLVVSSTFEAVTSAFVLAAWPFYALSVAAVYRLRRRPGPAGTSESPGRRLAPAVFVAAVGWLVLNALVTEPGSTGLTFAPILSGVPVYYVAFRRG